jgi:hypothetical protein
MDRQLKRDSSSTWTSNAHDLHGALSPGKRTLIEHASVAPRVAEGVAPDRRRSKRRFVSSGYRIRRTEMGQEPASPADDSAASRVAAPPHEAAVNSLPRDPAGEGSDGIGDSAASRVAAPPHEAAANLLPRDPLVRGVTESAIPRHRGWLHRRTRPRSTRCQRARAPHRGG